MMRISRKLAPMPKIFFMAASKASMFLGIWCLSMLKVFCRWKYMACFEESPSDDSPSSTASSRSVSKSSSDTYSSSELCIVLLAGVSDFFVIKRL